MKHLSLVVLLILASFFSSQIKADNPTTFDLNYSLDSYGSNPETSHEVIEARLAALNTTIDMTYSEEVVTFIEKYMKYGRKQVTSLLVRSAYYLPIFEKALKEAGLPDELKYLPIVESHLNAKATSRAGAAGLWQFMSVTAKGYDMRVTSSVDERRDPYLSSVRACKMLKDLYDKFGDWQVVLAAYNAGPGTVQKAMKRAGVTSANVSFRAIKSYLPAETRKYVPKFIAINYVMNYYPQHNIPTVQIDNPFTTDAIQIYEKGSLRKIASLMSMPLEDLRTLNPHFTTDVIPASMSRPYNLILPSHLTADYLTKNGRGVEEISSDSVENQPALADNNKPSAPIKNVAESKTDSSQTNSNDKLRNWNNYAFEDVPSKDNPNTFVRVPKKVQNHTDSSK